MKHSRMRGIAWLLLAPALMVQAQKASGDLAAKIQRLDDMEEIRTLLLTYGRTLDAHDLVAYSNLFSKDGEWVGGFGTSGKGPAGVLALMEKNLPAPAKGKQGSTYHLMSNFLIDVKGDTGTAWSRWAFIVPSADKPSFGSGGHYEDTLVRENGHWKFKRRVAFTDIPHFDPTESK